MVSESPMLLLQQCKCEELSYPISATPLSNNLNWSFHALLSQPTVVSLDSLYPSVLAAPMNVPVDHIDSYRNIIRQKESWDTITILES